ncbi:NADP-dependent malic enzyme [Vagococcus coleopterorum]|uniref:NADP-dependent malic enzyme n=1 Tax=Vagococcus coleopterorum TaxID=2714946 RepID=A0A6G8AM00_9ENTE|nr:NADP-dependent malic enzyme [Vagococcus coleopterorum]QIL46000.1 NADP-dependent malic enzyme [Vagococcus coleopterorum]
MTDVKELAIEQARKHGGKMEIVSKVAIDTMEDLAIAYTPGVGAVCMEIAEDKEKAYEYTTKKNMVAVVTDGSAVLGLGNIGPEAAIPVMEGKATLFKRFADVDAIPISLNTQDTEEIIQAVAAIAPSFAGINLEDIGAPRCFEIETRLKEMLDIPVFHDDQHGTAIVVLAALLNGLRLTDKKIEDIKIVIMGAGAAGLAIARLFLSAGAKNVQVLDRTGIICADNPDLPDHHKAIAEITNPNRDTGTAADALVGADVFVGVSGPGALKPEWVSTMAEKSMVFAMANPTPEIMPDEAKAAGAYIIGTGRSDFPNQINNVLCFPGIFRGAIDARANDITVEMQIAAAEGIAAMVSDEELNPERILPDVFKPGVSETVANSVKNAVK